MDTTNMPELRTRSLLKDRESGTLGVAISHGELDSLVGRLMEMCDLIGDKEQRTALKSEIKRHCRSWLDDNYFSSGYDKFTGVVDEKNVVTVN